MNQLKKNTKRKPVESETYERELRNYFYRKSGVDSLDMIIETIENHGSITIEN